MEKKSIDNLKDQEVDAKNVKGGFALTRKNDSTGFYTVNGMDDRINAINDAKVKGFKYATLTHKESGKSETVKIG